MNPDQPDIQLSEDELVQQEFDALLNDYLNSPHRKKVELITKAFNFAKAAHKGFRRRSGEPYIMHPLAVARIVSSEIGMGSTSICSALLHDVVEDTDYTVEDISNLFGPKIAQIVEGLTKISGGVFAEHASAQAENFRKLVLTMSEDIRVILIKIADRLHNMRTLGSMPPAKQYKITGETQYIYAPLAHRLGLFRIKNELENLSFRYEHPDTYARIEKKLAANEAERNLFYDEFTDPISQRLAEQGWQFRYKARVKTVYSIWKKMTNRNIPFEDVYDIMALRIIFTPKEGLTEKEQCWMIYSALTAIYKPHPDRIRDWVSNPKANGYEALHVTVMAPGGRWVEIQIRTERMNDIAEKGLAAHWKYKTGEGENESELDKWMKTIKELLENPEPNAIDFIDTFKLNLFASEIFVFTPKGEIKTIPQGSTALDFAFDIHSDLGEHCIGAKVNHKLVPLSHTLQSGDQVEILTSKKQLPHPEWIDYVTTAKAKAKIRAIFKREEKLTITEGQKKLDEALAAIGKKADNETIVKIMKYHHFDSRNTLFMQIGSDKINLDELAQTVFKPQNRFTRYLKIPFVNTTEKPKPDKQETDEVPAMVPASRIDRKKTFLLNEENAGLTYRYAPCCKPIPGDDVLGYVDENEIVIVHRRECPTAAKLKSNFGNNLVSAKWSAHKTLTFNEVLEITGIDKKGVLIEILRIISEQYGVNISKIHIETNAGIFLGQFYIYVHDKHEIETLAKNINKIKEVNSTHRVMS